MPTEIWSSCWGKEEGRKERKKDEGGLANLKTLTFQVGKLYVLVTLFPAISSSLHGACLHAYPFYHPFATYTSYMVMSVMSAILLISH